MDENRIDIIRKHLSFRFERIKKIFHESEVNSNNLIRKRLYKAISFFIYFVRITEETKFSYHDLNIYNKSVKEKPEFKIIQVKAFEKMKSLIDSCLEMLDFDDSEKRYNNSNWISFFPMRMRALPFQPLKSVLTNWKEHLTVNEIDFQITDEFIGLIGSILEKDASLLASFPFDELNFLNSSREEFQFHQTFLAEFEAALSASALERIYFAHYPIRCKSEPMDLVMMRNFILDGKEIESLNELMEHCENVYAYINFNLDIELSKNILIKKFCTYIGLYSSQVFPSGVIKNENVFQIEFARFLFLSGYFPIREAMLGRGRLDVLSVSAHSAVLYELKQMGFGKTKNKESLMQKFYSAKIQVENYRNKLSTFPGITKDVHIILFSSLPINFKNDLSLIPRGGINFHFWKIVVLNSSVTKSVKEIEIDVEKLF